MSDACNLTAAWDDGLSEGANDGAGVCCLIVDWLGRRPYCAACDSVLANDRQHHTIRPVLSQMLSLPFSLVTLQVRG